MRGMTFLPPWGMLLWWALFCVVAGILRIPPENAGDPAYCIRFVGVETLWLLCISTAIYAGLSALMHAILFLLAAVLKRILT